MSTRLIGYLELWSFFNRYGTVTSQDIEYIKPYTDIIFSFIVLWAQPDSMHPVLPPSDSTFDGNFYYGGGSIISRGAKITNTPRAQEFWSIADQWSTILHQNNKKFIISFGGWLDIQATPQLLAEDAKTLYDGFMLNLDTLLSVLPIDGVDFDWEHLAVINVAGANEQVEQYIALQKCMFLGYLMANIKRRYPHLSLNYTTRSNTFYPFMHEGSHGTLWGSDREGVGVALGMYLYSVYPEFTWPAGYDVSSYVQLMYSSDGLDKSVVQSLTSILSGITLMTYDGSVGSLALKGCYTLDEYEAVLSQTIDIMDSAHLLFIGIEPIKQAVPCADQRPCSSFCDLNGPDTLNLNIVKGLLTPVYALIQKYKTGGLFLWGINEFVNADNMNTCLTARTFNCMADYALVLARAYAYLANLSPSTCQWYQQVDDAGNCRNPPCPDNRLAALTQSASGLSATQIIGISIGSIGLILTGIALIGRHSISIWKYLLISGLVLLFTGIGLSFVRKTSSNPSSSFYKCDMEKGCVLSENGGVSLKECQNQCQSVVSYRYDEASNTCKPVKTYGQTPVDTFGSKQICERAKAKYACVNEQCQLTDKGISFTSCINTCKNSRYSCDASSGQIQCIPDSKGALDNCDNQAISYILNSSTLTCIPTCTIKGTEVSKEVCEQTIPYACKNSTCVPQKGGVYKNKQACLQVCGQAPPSTCKEGEISLKNPSTGKYVCVPCGSAGPPFNAGHVCSSAEDCKSGYCQAVNCTDSQDVSKVQYNHDNHLCRKDINDMHCY